MIGKHTEHAVIDEVDNEIDNEMDPEHGRVVAEVADGPIGEARVVIRAVQLFYIQFNT